MHCDVCDCSKVKAANVIHLPECIMFEVVLFTFLWVSCGGLKRKKDSSTENDRKQNLAEKAISFCSSPKTIEWSHKRTQTQESFFRHAKYLGSCCHHHSLPCRETKENSPKNTHTRPHSEYRPGNNHVKLVLDVGFFCGSREKKKVRRRAYTIWVLRIVWAWEDIFWVTWHIYNSCVYIYYVYILKKRGRAPLWHEPSVDATVVCQVRQAPIIAVVFVPAIVLIFSVFLRNIFFVILTAHGEL